MPIVSAFRAGSITDDEMRDHVMRSYGVQADLHLGQLRAKYIVAGHEEDHGCRHGY